MGAGAGLLQTHKKCEVCRFLEQGSKQIEMGPKLNICMLRLKR